MPIPMTHHTRRPARLACVALVVLSAGVSSAQPSLRDDRYILPNETVQDLFRRNKNLATLDNLSPDGDHFLIPQFQELTDLKRMSQKTYRLAMLEFCPDVNREWRLATYGNDALDLYSLSEKRRYPIRLPQGIFVSDMRWSPDGKQLAFLAHLADATYVWIADTRTGETKPAGEAKVLATLAARPGGGGEDTSAGERMLQWLPDGSIVTVTVPTNRGPEPPETSVPTAPIIRRSRDKPTPTPTAPFLLRTARDEQLFKYYTTGQLSILSPGKPARAIGEPAMYLDFKVSPDGKYILRETLTEPFSYLVGLNGFGRALDIADVSGKVLTEVRRIPLQEAQQRGGDRAADDLPREVAWRPDGRGLSLLWRAPRASGSTAEANGNGGDRDDRLMLVEPPFDIARARVLVTSKNRLSNVSYARDGRHAFLTETIRSSGGGRSRQDLTAWAIGGASPARHVLKGGIDPDDAVALPGDVWTRTNGNGIEWALTSPDGNAVFLKGNGYKATFKPQPFVDRVAIVTAATERVFEGSAELFDRPLVPLDPEVKTLIVSREGKSLHPDSFRWTRGGGMEKLTANVDPYPEITAAERVDFSFTRADGVTVQARISLPVGYRPGTRVPAIFWTYPNEFATAKEYASRATRTHNQNAYSPLSFLRWSDIWLTQGYALVYPDIPILGENDRFNDRYRTNLVDTLYGALRKVDELGYVDVNRVGHGGHSYGAFTTANLLAHTPFFKAGIAGDGAYNRTLTPMTFQGERRNFWDAPTTYLEMSPFLFADQINAPLLMYHGAQDNNSGTAIIQSERMMQALTGLGKTAALYIYPYESHAPRARENFLDLWARWLEWFDKYVKGAESAKTTTAQ